MPRGTLGAILYCVIIVVSVALESWLLLQGGVRAREHLAMGGLAGFAMGAMILYGLWQRFQLDYPGQPLSFRLYYHVFSAELVYFVVLPATLPLVALAAQQLNLLDLPGLDIPPQLLYFFAGFAALESVGSLILPRIILRNIPGPVPVEAPLPEAEDCED